jgi:PKD repeat protein
MWSWGDGSANSFGIAPSHTYSVPGNYEICLTATDSLGCSDTYCDSSTYLNRGTEVTTIVTVNAIIVQTVVRSPDNDINSITVYPNPAVNSVVIEARRETPFEKIIIYSIEGRKVQEEILHTKSSKVEINVSILSKGVYFLNCIFEKTSRMVIMTKE